MKVHEAAKKLGISTKVFLETYGEERGIKSHLSNLPESLVDELFGEEKKIQAESEPTQTVDSGQADLVELTAFPETGTKAVIRTKECPISKADLRVSICCLGNKSPYYEWKDMLNG